MKFYKIIIAAVCMLALLATTDFSKAQAVDIALSQVGDPGNAADGTGYGAVSYDYAIGTFDVTLTQYCTFLNDVATADPYGLYNSSMATAGNYSGDSTGAGILQAGASGSYVYSVIGTSGSDPVSYVSWLDAARFCNWLQNGELTTGTEGANTTEDGAYTLNGDIGSGQETKNANATWWIPSEDEWYKAAYYDPNYGGLGVGGYWTYATRSNTAPGNTVGSGTNEANYYNGVYSTSEDSSYSAFQNYLTPVESFTNSASYYGTYDQSGDVFQWTDATSSDDRVLRGGDWYDGSFAMESSYRLEDTPYYESYDIGFRVASDAIPEPSTWTMMAAGVGALVAFRRHRRS